MSTTSQQPSAPYPLPKVEIKSNLGRHRILALSAGVRVSPLCLGAMNFGNAWKEGSHGRVYEGDGREVAATKWSSRPNTAGEPWQLQSAEKPKIQSDFGGGASKNFHPSVEASLRKLRTGYIDLLYVHYWDMTASVPSLTHSLLHHLPTALKIL
ncbi:MAG: hypothetical protein Q9222_004155 [Ikaeria aurantiellina]